MNIDDLELEAPIAEVDEFLLQLTIKYKFPALLTSSVMLARLMWLNRQSDSTEDFGKLLSTVVQGIHNKEFTIPEQGSMH